MDNMLVIGIAATVSRAGKHSGDSSSSDMDTPAVTEIIITPSQIPSRIHVDIPGGFSEKSSDAYDKYFVKGQVMTEAEESYTSHNTTLLDADGVVRKILTTDYVREQLASMKG